MAIHDMNQMAICWLADHLQNFGAALCAKQSTAILSATATEGRKDE